MSSFNKFNINDDLTSSLNKNGVKNPTQIQELIIPKLIKGDSLVAKSNTGTGKTLAFIIPILNNIIDNKVNSVLILAPTRELVIQISDEFNKIISKLENNNFTIDLTSIYGGKNIQSQINKLKKSINIIVATPGRLLDHIQRNTIDLTNMDTIIIDEADQMLLMGFRGEIDLILSKVNKINQIVLLSATIDSKIKKLAYRYNQNIDFISSESRDAIPDTIKQIAYFTTDRSKFDDLSTILKNDNPFLAIIFCRTKARVDSLELKLGQSGYNCDKIHSDISQAKRERILKNFRDMKTQLLISTDLAARGLDINGLSHIYNYDFPENPEDYIHRIGRTGRIGKDGIASSFITDKNIEVYNEVKKLVNNKIEEAKL